jgi:TRAP-type C4-dicarboxylate transport system permease large subunit
MFMAGVIPGLLGLVMYGLTVAVLVIVFPNIAQPGKATTLKEKFLGLKGLVPFTGVFVFIIGGIYSGWFTPTEASAVGAAATLLIALVRGMRFEQFKDAVGETLVKFLVIFSPYRVFRFPWLST